MIELFERNGLKMGKIDFAGTVTEACLAFVPEVQIGQYALVHAGFAINVLDEEEANKTLALFEEINSDRGSEAE